MRSIVKTAVFVVIALFREKGFLDDKAPPPGKIFEVLIEKFAEYTICDEFMEKNARLYLPETFEISSFAIIPKEYSEIPITKTSLNKLLFHSNCRTNNLF